MQLIDTKDILYGLRTLLRNRAFAATALVTLMLATGATTAIFTVIHAVLLRPLPYRDSQRLVTFFEDMGQVGYPRTRVSPPTFLNLKA
jgi:putative ABC transport system permease protein